MSKTSINFAPMWFATNCGYSIAAEVVGERIVLCLEGSDEDHEIMLQLKDLQHFRAFIEEINEAVDGIVNAADTTKEATDA